MSMSFFANAKIIWKIAGTFAFLICVSLGVNGYIYLQRETLADTIKWNDHTYEVLGEMNAVMASIVDQETGIRGYLITSKPDSLAPYERGRREYAEHFRRLKELTSDNPAQQERLDQVDRAAQAWNENVEQKAIALMANSASRDQAVEIERNGIGKQYVDGIRAKVGDAERAERQLLDSRSAAQHAALSTITSSILVGAAVMLATAVISIVLLLGQIARPVSRLTGVMLRLADGKLDLDIPFPGRKDEIGEMARAVQVFKDNSLRVKQMEAEQKEAEKRTAAERETAMRKMADEFEAAVGGIVQSAIAGDFSKRVDLNGKTGLVLNVGTMINSLCENVATALVDVIDMLRALADGNLTQRTPQAIRGISRS
jgi:methyl-accepting chemotaxis protein